MKFLLYKGYIYIIHNLRVFSPTITQNNFDMIVIQRMTKLSYEDHMPFTSYTYKEHCRFQTQEIPPDKNLSEREIDFPPFPFHKYLFSKRTFCLRYFHHVILHFSHKQINSFHTVSFIKEHSLVGNKELFCLTLRGCLVGIDKADHRDLLERTYDSGVQIVCLQIGNYVFFVDGNFLFHKTLGSTVMGLNHKIGFIINWFSFLSLLCLLTLFLGLPFL